MKQAERSGEPISMPLPEGSLFVGDTGYFTLCGMRERTAAKQYFLTQAKQNLARLTHQSPASPAPEKQDGGETHLRPREQRKLDKLIETVTHLPNAPFHCALVILLLTHEGQDLSYPEIAHSLHYELGTVRHRTTTVLREEGLIARATSGTGYTSRFSEYCDTRFPGEAEVSNFSASEYGW